MSTTAEIIKHSINPHGQQLATFKIKYWRGILSEFNTHRSFCVSGDAVLDFEHPTKEPNGTRGRIYHKTIREFYDHWHKGAKQKIAPRFNGKWLDHLQDDLLYTASQIRDELGYMESMPLTKACRAGELIAQKGNKQWEALGKDWKSWRRSKNAQTHSVKNLLKRMSIRQADENNNAVCTSNVLDCVFCGVKPVFKITAGKFSTSATKDHLILTSVGWKRMEDIVVGEDAICVYSRSQTDKPLPIRIIGGRHVSVWIRSIKRKVFLRQNGMCAISNIPLESRFDIHHKEPVYLRPDLAFDIDNVVAVTKKAHLEQHTPQGWKGSSNPLISTFEIVTSIIPNGEIDTYDLEIAGEFPNFFADGIAVHNSRNSASSRAIPFPKMLQTIRDDIAEPAWWGTHQKGMQSGPQLDTAGILEARDQWRKGFELVADRASYLHDTLGVHKSIVNRMLEPWSHMTSLVSMTEFHNFFALRAHKDAQPEFQVLAYRMLEALLKSKPIERDWGEWHMPYDGDMPDGVEALQSKIIVATARMAWVSYGLDGQKATREQCESTYEKLLSGDLIHASPAEHVAIAEASQYNTFKDLNHINKTNKLITNRSVTGVDQGNFRGWTQWRKFLPRETVTTEMIDLEEILRNKPSWIDTAE